MNATLKMCVVLLLAFAASFAGAKGGGSSGGGGHGGGGGHASSGGGRSVSSVSARPGPSPSAAPRPTAPQAAAPARTTTTTTTTRTVNSSSRYVSGGGVAYGGMGSGYHYDNGLMTGLLIGNMMHPTNTVVYAGGGAYNNNALLYPDGRVVNQHGQQIGTYQNGQFTEMQNGPMAAQPIPQDALAPVEKEKTVSEWLKDIFVFVVVVLSIIFLILLLFGLLA